MLEHGGCDGAPRVWRANELWKTGISIPLLPELRPTSSSFPPSVGRLCIFRPYRKTYGFITGSFSLEKFSDFGDLGQQLHCSLKQSFYRDFC